MTDTLFLDAYLKSAEVSVTGHQEAGVITDATLFYAQGGGQPGDQGRITWDGGSAVVVNSVKADGGIAMILEEGSDVPPVGAMITQTLNWERRFRHMQIHTALHLLSVVIPLPVTGGAISFENVFLILVPSEISAKDFFILRFIQVMLGQLEVFCLMKNLNCLFYFNFCSSNRGFH